MAAPAQAATINSLVCESRVSRISCDVSASTSQPATFTWIVNQVVVPNGPIPSRLSPRSCTPGKFVSVVVVVVDNASTASKSGGKVCRSGNP